MGSYYEKMRDDVKIVEALKSSDTEDDSAVALKRLRPREVKQASQTGGSLKFHELIEKEEKSREDQKYGKWKFSPIITLPSSIHPPKTIKYLPQNEMIRR
jgi:hypothetical protein